MARIPEGSLVLPAILTEEHITLGAELADGSVVVGQHQISHPSAEGVRPASAGGWRLSACLGETEGIPSTHHPPTGLTARLRTCLSA